MNKKVQQALEKTIDLRSLAQEPPKENAQECLRLMGMALKNLASAMNNTQALVAAAIILGSEPTPIAIAWFEWAWRERIASAMSGGDVYTSEGEAFCHSCEYELMHILDIA
ncbi:hypothetical protein [uncultured Nostoc sp.]|uniref:hypothetical protein n=1 Tax=uncultured Nostoc sp. TaxID=340711 RepID=UPI0035C9934F